MIRRSEVPAEFRSSGKATEKQISFIRSLMDERNLFASPKWFDATNAMDHEEYAEHVAHVKENTANLTKQQASKCIECLLALPKAEEAKPRQGQWSNVPDGHYALEMPQDEVNPIHFYKLETGKSGRWEGFRFLDRFSSDETCPVKGDTKETVMARLAENPKAAAVLYGHTTERCCLCHRKLTRPESRKAGIGPVCAGREGW